MKLRKHGDIIGKQFGALECIGPFDHLGNTTSVFCQCQCGRRLQVRICALVSGETKSCGCMTGEFITLAKIKHGEASSDGKSPEYRAWIGMIMRCENPALKYYHRYGGRGIRVCEEWRGSFAAFLADVGRRPTGNHTLDRIDNNGNYEPGNVRWSTRREQANNRQNNRQIQHGGESLTLTQWARRTGIPVGTIFKRLSSGWSVDSALGVLSCPKN